MEGLEVFWPVLETEGLLADEFNILRDFEGVTDWVTEHVHEPYLDGFEIVDEMVAEIEASQAANNARAAASLDQAARDQARAWFRETIVAPQLRNAGRAAGVAAKSAVKKGAIVLATAFAANLVLSYVGKAFKKVANPTGDPDTDENIDEVLDVIEDAIEGNEDALDEYVEDKIDDVVDKAIPPTPMEDTNVPDEHNPSIPSTERTGPSVIVTHSFANSLKVRNPDVKHHFAGPNIGSARPLEVNFNPFSINAIPEGVGSGKRVGVRVENIRLEVRGHISIPDNYTQAHVSVIHTVVYDTKPQRAPPTLAEFTSLDIHGFPEQSVEDRYKIIHRAHYSLTNHGGNSHYILDDQLALLNQQTRYVESSVADPPFQHGRIFDFLHSNHEGVETVAPTFEINYRLFYKVKRNHNQ